MNIIFKPECKTEIIKPTYDLPIIGEPISKTGASANNSNAYGVIVGIIGDGSSRRVRVMTEGYIDYDKVKENYMVYTDEAINALTGITLCSGGKLPTGVQPDWNQNDNTQPDYVKNRPFYTGDTVETVLVEESTVEFIENSGQYGALFPTSFNAEFGATYKVSWDGSIYTCACKNINNKPAIGNLSIIGTGSDTGEPFVIFNEGGLLETGWTSVATDTSASHTISISSFTGGIVKIDEKYLPDRIISDISTAQSTANAAQSTANNAQSTANAAQSTANAAQSTANNALPSSGGVIQIGSDLDVTLTLDEFTGSTGVQKRGIRIGGNGAYGNPILEVTHDDITIYDGVSQRRVGGLNGTELFLTAKNSDNTFKITVDDSGTLTATKVTK